MIEEMKALEDALLIVNRARVEALQTNKAAWQYLLRVTKRLQDRQQDLFAASFGGPEFIGTPEQSEAVYGR